MPNHPPPLLLHRQTTTTQILHHTTATIFSTRHHLFIFLWLSFFLFSFHTQVETILHSLTSYIDNNPSLQTHFEQFKNPPKPINHFDPFHSSFDNPPKWAFHSFFDDDPQPKPQLNATSLPLSTFLSENGPRVSEYIHSSTTLTFKVTEDKNTVSKENQDFTPWLIVTSFLASYGLTIFAFIITYSMVNGVIFVMVMIHFLKKNRPLVKIFRDGFDLGMNRVSWLYGLKWVLMDGLTQVLGLCFFGNFYDPYTQFKIFVRLKFMPFTSSIPWVEGLEKDMYGFRFTWIMFDMYLSSYFSGIACAAIADSRNNGLEAIEEGSRWMSLMVNPATDLRLLQYLVCHSFGRNILAHFFGPLFGGVIQSCMEAYFLVAWMIYYLCVKSMDANSRGAPFGQRELEAMLVDAGQVNDT